MLQHLARRSAVTAATALAATSVSLLFGGGAAHATGTYGIHFYAASVGTCEADLWFNRQAGGNNTAQGVVSTQDNTDGDVQCIGALERSSNGGTTWNQISATHSVWGNTEYPVTSETYWYADGAKYLARTCVYAVNHYTGRTSSTVCTSAH
jgi:hypothetical protein